MTIDGAQDKHKEMAFFDAHAESDEYDVFTPQANEALIAAFMRLSGLPGGARVADLGCGSGVFTELLRRRGYQSVGLDISPKLLALGRRKYPGLKLEGDAENLPFENASLDGVLLSGLAWTPSCGSIAITCHLFAVLLVSPKMKDRFWPGGSLKSFAPRVFASKPTISQGLLTATSPRRACVFFCPYIISLITSCSILRSCSHCAPSY